MRSIFTILLFLSIPCLVGAQSENEPNNSFETANFITPGVARTGTVDNRVVGGLQVDAYDYYMAIFASDGTLQINITGINTHSSAGYLYLYGYDRRKGSGQVLAQYLGNTSNVAAGDTIYDVISVYGRAADTFYFRLETSVVFNYSITYNITNVSTNDVEPNNSFAQALTIGQLQQKEGHIGYIKNGAADADDFYMTRLPVDGTLQILVSGTNRSGASGYLYMYAYDRRQGSGQIMAKYVSNSSNIKADLLFTIPLIFMAGRLTPFIFGLFRPGPLVIT